MHMILSVGKRGKTTLASLSMLKVPPPFFYGALQIQTRGLLVPGSRWRCFHQIQTVATSNYLPL